MRGIWLVALLAGCAAPTPTSDIIDLDGDGLPADEDCNDRDATVAGPETERCNGIDDDCDGLVDEELTTTFYADVDGDGSGGEAVEACERGPSHVDSPGDCDDADPLVHPEAVEDCSAVDRNCDGDAEHGAVGTAYYPDLDGDGHGTGVAQEACTQPAQTADVDDDCDDTDPLVHPDADEDCSAIDRDCDGDTTAGALDATTTWDDHDLDGFGTGAPVTSCDGTGRATVDGDCDDTDPHIHPGATETCAATDQDCDGDPTAGAADASQWYADADGDGFGDAASTSTVACAMPLHSVEDHSDCDDSLHGVNPAAAEVCGDGLDNDCVGGDLSCDVIHHCGPITADEVWQAGVHVLTCDVSVDGATLTLEDGVHVRIGAGLGLEVGNDAAAQLQAHGGTVGIEFESDEATPESGDHDGLVFGPFSAGSELVGATMRHGGRAGPCIAIEADVLLEDVQVLGSGDDGISLEGGHAVLRDVLVDGCEAVGVRIGTSVEVTLEGTTLSNNVEAGLCVHPDDVRLLSPDNTYAGGNVGPDIKVTQGAIVTPAVWPDLDAPLTMTGNVTQEHTATLEIQAPHELRWQANRNMAITSGATLTIAGTPTERVLFHADDGQPGGWTGLRMRQGAIGQLVGLEMAHAGTNGLDIDRNRHTVIRDSLIRDGSGTGIRVNQTFTGTALLDMQDTTVRDHAGIGVDLGGASIADLTTDHDFRGNVMVGNGGAAFAGRANMAGELDSTCSFAGNGEPIVLSNDDIFESQTWHAQDAEYWLMGNLQVDGHHAPVLTLDPGVRIRAHGARMGFGNSSNEGTLSAIGTVDQPIQLLGLEEVPGAWLGVRGSEHGHLHLEHVEIAHAGSGADGGGIRTQGTQDVQLSHVTVRDSAAHGFNAVSDFPLAHTHFEATDCRFENNAGFGIYTDSARIVGTEPSFVRNTFVGNGGSMTTQPWNLHQLGVNDFETEVHVRAVTPGSHPADRSGTWRDLGVPYRVEGSIRVGAHPAPTVVIEAGAVFRMNPGTRIDVGTTATLVGALQIVGEVDNPVVFTSASDTPAPGDWHAVRFNQTCDHQHSVVTHAEFEYGGSNGAMLSFNGCPLNVSDVRIAHSADCGLELLGASLPTVGAVDYDSNNPDTCP